MSNCPCGSPKPYLECCVIFHEGIKAPETAEQLMRSRYCAFVKKLPSYLVETHDPKTRSSSLRESLEETFESVEWIKLEVLSCEGGMKGDREGKVHFRATFSQGGPNASLEENSQFVKRKKRWLYVGEVT